MFLLLPFALSSWNLRRGHLSTAEDLCLAQHWRRQGGGPVRSEGPAGRLLMTCLRRGWTCACARKGGAPPHLTHLIIGRSMVLEPLWVGGLGPCPWPRLPRVAQGGALEGDRLPEGGGEVPAVCGALLPLPPGLGRDRLRREGARSWQNMIADLHLNPWTKS